MKTIEELKAELFTVECKIEPIQRAQNGGYTAQVAKSFHLGMVGGSGRNIHRLNKRRDQELDKTIDRAVILTGLYSKRDNLKKQIDDIESGAVEKRAATMIDRQRAKAEFWRNLKAGDELPLGNSNGNPIIAKKSFKSCTTTSGTKWTAAEIIGKEAAKYI